LEKEVVIPAKFPMPRLGAWHPRMDENGLFSNEAGIQFRYYSGFQPLDARLRGHDEL